jgi:signal transduction histidine kinase
VNRLRVWFACVALVCLAGVGALVWRALDVAETERRLRHDAVAGRVLDEMERALSELVAAQDAGPEAPRRYDFVVGQSPDTALEVDRLLRAPEAAAPANGPFGDARQSAGTTLPVSPQAKALEEKVARRKDKMEKEDTYEVLAKLNKGAELRMEKQKAAEKPTIAYAPPAPSFAPAPARGELGRASERPQGPEPFHGRVLDATHLVLERTIYTGGVARNDSQVLDVPRLFDWLRARAIGEDLAGLARVEFAGPVAAELPAPQGEFVYRRRFAEPFESLGAQLTLTPLPGGGTTGAIQMLGAALAVVLVLGLGVAYRTVATVVSFAQRRAAFAASVSHELKTPLTAIRMYAEMLRDGMVSSEEKRDEYYQALAHESDRLSRLVNNVLEFSQLEKGARKLALGVAPVEPALRESLEVLRVHVEREGFALVTDVAQDLPPARFERDALAQIVFNLVDNAVKYACRAERREIIVSLARTPSGVTLSVRDFGPGVARGELPLVFEPFWRADSELTRRAKGTGIGLALVQRLAGAMGASVQARNVEPRGFEVTVQLATGS